MNIPRSISFGRTPIITKNQPLHGSKEVAEEVEKPLTTNATKKGTLIPREALISLAADFKSGAIDHKEANSRFIELVVDNSMAKKLSEKHRQELIKDVAEFFSEDEDFIKSLEKNLSLIT